MLVASFDRRAAEQISHFNDIQTYPIWVEIVEVKDVIEGRANRTEKPSQFVLADVYKRLAKILGEKGLEKGTIGIDMESYTLRSYALLSEYNSKVKFIDAEPLFWDLRSVKTPEEIQVLKAAAQITETGITAMVEGGIEGATIGELQYKYKLGLMKGINKQNALAFDGSRATRISAGDHFLSMNQPNSKILRGQNICCDAGISLDAYVSDVARTFVVGKANDLQRRIFNALKTGSEAALNRLGPGVKMREIFEIAMQAIRKAGLDWYTRGNMGHTIGIGPGNEQPPFISATEDRAFEPNMVICLETPLYVNGLGGFQLEDEIMITKTGFEFLSTLPREMVEL